MGNDGSLWRTLAAHAASDDATLVANALAGQTLARRTLVDRYLPLIYSVCRRSGLRTHDAEDVAQTIVMRVFQNLAQYRAESKLSTWIFTLSKRCVADFYRRPQQREDAVDWADSNNEAIMNSLGNSADHANQRDADKLTQLIATLDEPARSVMLHYYLADESVGDIARALSLPEGTIKTILFRSRSWLREQLEISK